MRSLPPLLAAAALTILGHASLAQPAEDALRQMRDCLQLQGEARQQCVGRIWSNLAGEDAPAPSDTRGEPPALVGGGNWVVSETTSPVDYSPQISASISAPAQSENAPRALAFHCRQNRAALTLSTTGSWRASSNNEFRVDYRVNEQPTIEERWSASAGGRIATYRGDVLKFLQSLPGNGQISVRVFDWQGPAHEAIFALDGLSAIRQKLVAACRPKAPSAEQALGRKQP
jgi:hypothetical protein